MTAGPDETRLRVMLSLHEVQAVARSVVVHRLEGVDNQVDHHLLNLHSIAPKERQRLGELRLDRGADLNSLTVSENDRVAERFI